MSTNTYVALKTSTVTNGTTASVTLDLSGIAGYTDLEIAINYGLSADADSRFIVNGDSTSGLYSYTNLRGNGSAAASGRASLLNYIQFGLGGVTVPTTLTSFAKLHLMNYTNTNVNKTILERVGDAQAQNIASVGLWRNTAAITSITFNAISAYFLSGSTFTVYGIAAVGGDTTPKATGGVVTSDATYYYHTFAGSNTFTALQSLSADILTVAGGGGGGCRGNRGGGGGGAGGLVYLSSQSLTAASYNVLVGAGGTAATTSTSFNAFNGTNSQFGALTAAVGGGYGSGQDGLAGSGGSGGGAFLTYNGGSGTSGQGYAGGNGGGYSSGYYYGTGGGGGFANAGANGASSSSIGSAYGGNGGTGTSTYSSWGLLTSTGQNVSGTVYYSGGGGGGTGDYNGGNGPTAGSGGAGGGGAGTNAANSSIGGTPGTATAGGGGGGANWGNGGNGGSGVIIVRYTK